MSKEKQLHPDSGYVPSTESGQTLRWCAEEIAQEKATLWPEYLEEMSPEEIRQTLHELREHQMKDQTRTNQKLIEEIIESDDWLR